MNAIQLSQVNSIVNFQIIETKPPLGGLRVAVCINR